MSMNCNFPKNKNLLDCEATMLEPIYIIAVQKTIDQISTPNKVDELLVVANNIGLTHKEFIIDPLSAGWNTPLTADHFRSGNSPLEAIEVACQQLRNEVVDIIIVSGEDNLKTGYTSQTRHEMMEIYPDLTLLEAYTKLAKAWCQVHKISTDGFIDLSKRLFDNYSKTYTESLPKGNINESRYTPPDDKWFRFVTDLFRGVDCANPVIDYSGKIMLTTKSIAEKLISFKQQHLDSLCLQSETKPIVGSVSSAIANPQNRSPQIKPNTKLIKIEGIITSSLSITSGIDNIPEIAQYDHLRQVFESACKAADIDFIQLFKNNQAYLEVYTCFPVVPLAFLYATGLATNLGDIEAIINNYLLTVTGGMNLAKAPWNLPVLRAIITLYHKLQQNDEITVAGVHGNGGLGEKQGFMILKAE
jgi:hypothetical protein